MARAYRLRYASLAYCDFICQTCSLFSHLYCQAPEHVVASVRLHQAFMMFVCVVLAAQSRSVSPGAHVAVPAWAAQIFALSCFALRCACLCGASGARAFGGFGAFAPGVHDVCHWKFHVAVATRAAYFWHFRFGSSFRIVVSHRRVLPELEAIRSRLCILHSSIGFGATDLGPRCRHVQPVEDQAALADSADRDNKAEILLVLRGRTLRAW